MIIGIAFVMVVLGAFYLADQNGQLKRALDRQIEVTKLWESRCDEQSSAAMLHKSKFDLLKLAVDDVPMVKRGVVLKFPETKYTCD